MFKNLIKKILKRLYLFNLFHSVYSLFFYKRALFNPESINNILIDTPDKLSLTARCIYLKLNKQSDNISCKK